MEYVYAIGDIHGEHDLFLELLEHFDSNTQQLVLLGDLLDRGPNSKQCLLLGQKLVEEKQAIYLRGNHEQIFLNFLQEPDKYFDNYMLNGGGKTIESLFYPGISEDFPPDEVALLTKMHYAELIDFLEHLPYYYEWEKYIFVHAGVDLSLEDWHTTALNDFIWIREKFHLAKNNTDKTIVFGHTPTPDLHGDGKTTDLWIKDGKIGIDGAGAYGGTIHGVVLNKDEIVQDYEVQNNEGLTKGL